MCAAACWVLGVATVLSFNSWAGWFPLGALPLFAKATFFDVLDHLTSNLLLPGAGFGLAFFVGWIVPETFLSHQLGLGGATLGGLRFLLRYVVPSGIAAATIAPFL